MIQVPDDRRPPMTPQLALRVAALGTFALVMFGIIFFRLWFLQVLSGQQYLAQASQNQVRDIAIPAARGDIVDRNGNYLVTSKQAIAVQISPPGLPVRLTTLTHELFIPGFLERDEGEREPPYEKYPWDGVSGVRPFHEIAAQTTVGVY